MNAEATVEDLLNDLAKRKGFDQIITDLDHDTRDLIRTQWTEIIKSNIQLDTPTENFLNTKYDHVLSYDMKDLKISQLARIHDIDMQQRICVNRNLHNGQTRHIKVEAKIEDNGKLYIAGNYV